MHRTQVGDARFPCGIEAFIGTVHIGKMRLSAALGYHLAIDDRRLASNATPRSVGVPGECALVRMFPVRLSMLVEIRESIELGIAIGVILVHYVNLHFAKASSEHNLAAGWQLLRREEKNLITQKGLVDGAKKLVRNVIGQFHAGNFGTE